MSDTKPTVRYEGDVRFVFYEHKDGTGLWESASVQALDHPVWGRSPVRTSEVLKKNSDGSFETRNTIYVPSLTFREVLENVQ